MCIGDLILGFICLLKDGECYFVLFKVNEVNFDKFENFCIKIFFENFILFYVNECLCMECGNGSIEDIIVCVFDLVLFIGKG